MCVHACTLYQSIPHLTFQPKLSFCYHTRGEIVETLGERKLSIPLIDLKDEELSTMDISNLADLTGSSAKSMWLSTYFRRCDHFANHHFSVTDSYGESSSTSTVGSLQISNLVIPMNAIAPPPVKSNISRIRRRTLRKKPCTKRKLAGGDEDNGSFFYDFGDGGNISGGDGDGGNGKGWNFDRFGDGHSWDDDDEEHYSSSADPTFDFVYEVISWVVLSNCVHYAFKKIVRIVAQGIGDAEREKVPVVEQSAFV